MPPDASDVKKDLVDVALFNVGEGLLPKQVTEI
jgi:hypothetical protein